MNNLLSNEFYNEILENPCQILKLEQLLIKGADINYQSPKDGYTALMIAVQKDDHALVDYLLQKGASPLVINKHKEIASDLTSTHSPIYQLLKNHELLRATYENKIELVKTALRTGADINFQGQGGYTAIMIAVQENNIELVDLLLINNADLSPYCNDGRGVYFMVSDDLIYQTLLQKKPFSPEDKKSILQKRTQGIIHHSPIISEGDQKHFTLDRLGMHDFTSTANDRQINEIETFYGYSLPLTLKKLFTQYNGGEPLLDRFGEEGEGTISHFYSLDDNRNYVGNIWWAIAAFSKYLGPNSIPIAEDIYGAVYYLKWVDGNDQIWLFQYGDQVLDMSENDNPNLMPTSFHFISNSVDEFLEALYSDEE